MQAEDLSKCLSSRCDGKQISLGLFRGVHGALVFIEHVNKGVAETHECAPVIAHEDFKQTERIFLVQAPT